LIWPEDGFASIALPATAVADFFPLPAAPAFVAQQTSRRSAVLRCAPARMSAASIAPGRSIAIEVAMVAGSKQRSQENTMATIGSFKKVNAEFQGEIVTLTVQARGVRIVPEAQRASEAAPSHRVFVGRAEIGAAWPKRSSEGRDYLSVKLDDPSFIAPIFANLFDGEDDTYNLIWSRGRRQNGD
jgi:uncharacterized protein (DUF736 family)